MPLLDEQELLRSLASAQRERIQDLEDQLSAATRMHEASVRVLSEVLYGAGASQEEILRASVAAGNVTRILRTQPPLYNTEAPIPGRVVNLGTSAAGAGEEVVSEATTEPCREWVEDCARYIGHTLTGKYAHWCRDWDFLPVDETTPFEFSCCTCFPKNAVLP